MEDKPKADLLLMGVILTFLLLTLLAFLLNEGKKYCVTPFKQRFFPNRSMDEESDDVIGDTEYNSRMAGVYNRRSTYASTRGDAGFNESREMNTIAEGYSSSEEYREERSVKKQNVNDTKM